MAVLVVAAPARGAEPGAPTSQALVRVADTHKLGGTILRDDPLLHGKVWDSKTVARLAGWARGRAGATADDIALLRHELSRPVSLSVAGAVSMGSYQGGFLYYTLRALTAARDFAARQGDEGEAWAPADQPSPLSLVTGASSGSINAFIAAVTSCQKPILDPRASLFWKTWLPVGATELESSAEVYPDGLLSIAPIGKAVGVVESAWNDGAAWTACAVDVGLSATRMKARMVQPLADVELSLPLQTEKLVFRVRRSESQTQLLPFAPPDDDPAGPLYQTVLRQLGHGAHPTLPDITSLLRASSAFSAGFPPHVLELQKRDGSGTDDAKFTDGGVFDDRPIGLAVEMRRWQLEEQKRKAPSTTAPPTRYIVQDPDVEDWGRWQAPPAVVTKSDLDHQPFIGTWTSFVGDFINTAFEVQLLDTLEREPTLYGHLELPPRRAPVAGAYLQEFLGFAESDFRVFDFFMGMVDAWQQLAQTSLAFQVMQATDEGPVIAAAPEFDCLLAWRAAEIANPDNPTPPPAAACAAVGADPKRPDPLLRSNLEALAHASLATRQWSRVAHPKAPNEEQVFLGALGAAAVPYVYRDLKYGSRPADATTVDLAIRDVLQGIINRTTTMQPFGLQSATVGGVGKALVNYYVYRPPTFFLAAALVSDRGFEVLGAHRLRCDCLPGLRAELALRAMGLHVGQDAREASPHEVLVSTAMGAVHLMDEFYRSPEYQLHFGAGWAVKTELDVDHPVLWRHGPEIVLGGALFQRLYLDIVANYYLDDCAENNHCANISAKVSPQAPALVEANWGLRLALGYRFFLD